MSNKSSERIDKARYSELLQLARQSRIKWVIDAKDNNSRIELHSKDKNNGDSNTNPTTSHKAYNVLAESVTSRVPATTCIQSVLDYLSEVVDDSELFDITTVAAALIDYEDYETVSNDNNNEITNIHNDIDNITYNEFVESLIHPAATDVVKSMQQFVVKLYSGVQQSRRSQTIGPEEQEFQNWSGEVWQFLDSHLYELMKKTKLWNSNAGNNLENSQDVPPIVISSTKSVKNINSSNDKEKNVNINADVPDDNRKKDCYGLCEAVKAHSEKFLFVKLHSILFASDLEDSHLDSRTTDRITALDFLTAEHLDIKSLQPLYEKFLVRQRQKRLGDEQGHNGASSSESSVLSTEQIFLMNILQEPVKYLSALSGTCCPMDKLACIKRCSSSIAQLLKESRSLKGDSSLPGADELLPMMVLTLKICNPPQLHSNIKYLQRFLRPKLLMSEAGYLLTNFVSAVYFLDNVDAKALTIDPDEFEKAMRRSRERARAAQEQALAISNQNIARNKNTQSNRNFGNPFDACEDSDASDSDCDIEELLAKHHKGTKHTKQIGPPVRTFYSKYSINT